jgi:hypothetical protein
LTRDEAMVILGLGEDRDPGSVRTAYASRKAELAERISSAATPGLRQQYKQQLARLHQVRDLPDRNRWLPGLGWPTWLEALAGACWPSRLRPQSPQVGSTES